MNVLGMDPLFPALHSRTRPRPLAGSETPCRDKTGAIDFAIAADTIGGEACVIIQHKGLRFGPTEDMELPYAAKDEFESLLESICASIASSPQGGASRASVDVEFLEVLDDIRRACEI